jgi:hypothetical protein
MGWGANVILPVGLAIQTISAQFPKMATSVTVSCDRISISQ